MDWAHMACKILTSRGEFMVHISSSSIGIITPRQSISTYGLGLSNESKLTAHITSLTLMASGFFNKSPYLHKKNNKTRGTSSYLRLMTQAHKSLWGNFGSHGLEGQEVCLVKLQRFKVDKRNMLLGVFSSTP